MAKKPQFRQAAGRCASCGRALARGISKCNGCRAKAGSNSNVFMLLALAVVVGAAYWKVFIAGADTHVLIAQAEADASASPPYVPSDFNGWLHYNTTDPILKDITRHDRLIGAGLGPRTPSGALLEMSASAQYGRYVMITFPAVPQACVANPCDVSLAWDDAPPEPYGFGLPLTASGGGTLLQTDEYDRFAADIAKAHTLKVIASLGMADDYVFVFPVAGFRASKVP